MDTPDHDYPEPPGLGPRPAPARVPESSEPPPTKATPVPVKILVGVLIGVVALVGISLFFVSQQNQAPPAAGEGTAQSISRPTPPGWSQRYVWSADITSGNTIAVGNNRVVYVSPKGSLTVLDADAGNVIFTSAANPVAADARPFISVIEGVPSAGIIDGTTLILWPLDSANGAEGRSITLAPNARVYTQGGGLMVSTGREHWIATSDGSLVPVTLLEGHVALGVTPEGALLSAPPAGSWMFNPGTSGQPTRTIRPDRSPAGTVGDMQVAWSSRGVVVAWGNMAEAGNHTVGLYDADTGTLIAETILPTPVVENGLPLTVSPRAEYASAGPMLADLDRGHVEVVVGWSTLMSDSRHLYGTRDGEKLLWNGEGTVELDAHTVIPWGTSEKGYAVVLDSLGTGQVRIGALLSD